MYIRKHVYTPLKKYLDTHTNLSVCERAYIVYLKAVTMIIYNSPEASQATNVLIK